MKLYDLPRNSKLKIEIDGELKDCTFRSIDGMYSYCFVTDEPDKVFHLSAVTPMIHVGNHYEIDPTSEPKED